MDKKLTKKQEMRDKVDKLLEYEEFITWKKLGISLKDHKNRHVTYEAKIVFDYMQELGIKYRHYREIYSDGKLFGNTGGFYRPVPISKRRRTKLQRIFWKCKDQ